MGSVPNLCYVVEQVTSTESLEEPGTTPGEGAGRAAFQFTQANLTLGGNVVPFVSEFVVALGDGVTPSMITENMEPVIDLPWITVMKIKCPNGTVWNIHLDPDGAETEDVTDAFDLIPKNSVRTFESKELRTLGSAREFTYQYLTPNSN